MEQICHRCGEAVHEQDTFCPRCGAPQLRYEAPEEPVAATNPAPAQRAGTHLGTMEFQTIRWRDAIRTAAILAIPTGLLSSLLGLEVLWMIAGGVALMSMYRRRTGMMPTSGMGWRMGALLGLFSAVIATATDGVSMLVQRYAMHQGATLDQHYIDLAKQVTSQMVTSNPQVATVLPEFLHFWTTPDGIAAMVLINAAGLAISMLIFAAAGGALGARLTARTAHSGAR